MKRLTVIILFIILVALMTAPKECNPMAISFSNTADQRISWGAFPAVQALTTKTIVLFTIINNLNYGDLIGLGGTAATDEDWEIAIDNASDKITFWSNWSTTDGNWMSNAAMTTGQHHIAISYDRSSSTNNPVFYVDGSLVASSRIIAPAGTYVVGTSNNLRIGSYFTGFNALNNIMQSVLIYKRILTAQEIADAYSSKLAIPTMQGLVFAPQLCAQGNVGEGGTLAAGNTIPDQISGALGVPSGSPVFAQDKYLTYK